MIIGNHVDVGELHYAQIRRWVGGREARWNDGDGPQLQPVSSQHIAVAACKFGGERGMCHVGSRLGVGCTCVCECLTVRPWEK